MHAEVCQYGSVVMLLNVKFLNKYENVHVFLLFLIFLTLIFLSHTIIACLRR